MKVKLKVLIYILERSLTADLLELYIIIADPINVCTKGLELFVELCSVMYSFQVQWQK